jgi:hypothetical protein
MSGKAWATLAVLIVFLAGTTAYLVLGNRTSQVSPSPVTQARGDLVQEGQVFHAGRPLQELTQEPLVFGGFNRYEGDRNLDPDKKWLETIDPPFPTEYDPATGRYRILGLEPGHYAASVSCGPYGASHWFTVGDEPVQEHDFSLVGAFHLTQPVDSSQRLPPPEESYHAGPVVHFEWEPVPFATGYALFFWRAPIGQVEAEWEYLPPNPKVDRAAFDLQVEEGYQYSVNAEAIMDRSTIAWLRRVQPGSHNGYTFRVGRPPLEADAEQR